MSPAEPHFSHVPEFTQYMVKVRDYLSSQPRGRVLDLPAGGGQFTDALRENDFEVISADINREREDYVYADMTERLPFEDEHFDYAVCLEGIEHVVRPYDLMQELFRVTRSGGQVILSTPNIACMYSRLQFLFTGTFFQFQPGQLLPPGEVIDFDRFHVSPISLHTLRYFGEMLGGRLIRIDGDKTKRRLLMPLYLLVLAIGIPWTRSLFLGRICEGYAERNQRLLRENYHKRFLFSRSLVVVFEKA
jgi:SAM-dependent methyltransferase